MKRDIAEQINTLMLEYAAKLDQSIGLVMTHGTEDDLVKYRRAVGKIMAEMLLEIMNPIYSEYPDLKPPRLHATPSGP